MNKISASMIVKNEEACLERCLKSIKDLDEIVIVDTGSTDKTAEIATRYTDRYFPDEYVWKDNFAEARNFSIKKCKGDWIFIIDADEWLKPGGVQKMRNAILKTKNDCMYIKCIHDKLGWEHQQPRLHRRKKDIFWVGAIHNYLNITSEEILDDIQVVFGYSPAHKDDPNRALRILLKVVADKPNCVREKFYLAREYSYKQDWIKTAYWCKEYIKVGFWGPERAETFLLLAKAYWYLQRGEDARDACLQAIKINADFKEPLNQMALMSGPNNKKKWEQFAKLAEDQNVLFKRKKAKQEVKMKTAKGKKKKK